MPNFYILKFFFGLRLNLSENITRAMLHCSSFVLERFDKIDYTLFLLWEHIL